MKLAAFVFSAAVFLPAGLAAEKPAVWPVDSLIKVFPDDAPGASRAPDQNWLVPRNGHASVQFAVRSAEKLSDLAVSVKLGGGLKVQVRRAGYVPVRANPPQSPLDEVARKAPGKFPDPLFEEMPFALAANETVPVWITIYAPAAAKPGVRKGTAVFSAGKTKIASVPFRVEVSRAVIPARQSLKVTNWFTLEPQSVAKSFNLGASPEAATFDSPHYWEIVENVARFLGAQRQNVIITPVMSLVEPKLSASGAISYDFSRFDRWVDIFTRAGAADVIEGAHLMDRVNGYDTALRIPAYVVENGAVKRQALTADDPRVEAHLNLFLPALYAHLKEKGWLNRYVQHVLDEAHGTEPPIYVKYTALVRKNLPGIKTIDAIDQAAFILGESCDIWVPQLGRFDDAIPAIRKHVEGGGEAWFYTCLFPQNRHLNRFIDYPLLKTRLLHWFNYRYDFTGFLHWGGNYWSPDPFDNVEPPLEDGHQLPAGDAFLTYPWREKNTIRSSIRFEAMREGIEDYELLRVVAAKDPERARALARKAIPELTDYVRDVQAFRRLQAELLTAASR